MWHKDWPIFYGTVILLHVLKTFWWRNVVLGIMDQCHTKIDLVKIYVGQWPIFHGPLILPYIIVIDLNYFYTLRNGASGDIHAHQGTCFSLINSVIHYILAGTQSLQEYALHKFVRVWWHLYQDLLKLEVDIDVCKMVTNINFDKSVNLDIFNTYNNQLTKHILNDTRDSSRFVRIKTSTLDVL